MAGTAKKTLEEILVEQAVLPKEKIENAQQEAHKTGETLRQVLLRLKVITEEKLMPYIAQSIGVPYVDISNYEISPDVVKLLPIDIIKKYKAIPIFKVGNSITLAVSDPFNFLAMDVIKKHLPAYTLKTVITSEKNIEELAGEYSGETEVIEQTIKGIDLGAFRTKAEVKKPGLKEEVVAPEEAPVVKLVNLMLTDAVHKESSDIHIEPQEHSLRIRFRIDGILQEMYSPPPELHEAIVSRIKVLSDLDIAQKRIPQDGKFRSVIDEKEFDFRVSTYPGSFGEDVVIRILDKTSVVIGLEKLGFSQENLEKLERLIFQPNGIILVTGPTGSGKSTTLYSALNKINKPDKKIITVEDPIEYQLLGISQSQVNVKAGFTFAAGLRSILRHDPDIIMVGEIRDLETAEVSIQAALTGHLVFSTLHTNDAASAPTRLIDMGVEPFLISSSVIGIVAQRLIRTICPKCKESYSPAPELLEELNFPGHEKKIVCSECKKIYIPAPGVIEQLNSTCHGQKEIHFYRGKGCSKCHHTGFSGRTLISEVIVVTDAIRSEILKRSVFTEIKKIAQKEGMKTIREDGFQKVMDGITSIEEVLRVA